MGELKSQIQRKQITQILAISIRDLIMQEHMDFQYLQEIRMRVGQPVIVLYKGREYILPTGNSLKKEGGKAGTQGDNGIS